MEKGFQPGTDPDSCLGCTGKAAGPHPCRVPSSACPGCLRRQQDLFRVLKAYTLYRPEEGYCQAQAPIAAVLLMHMPAEVRARGSGQGTQLGPPGGCGALWGGADEGGAQLRAMQSAPGVLCCFPPSPVVAGSRGGRRDVPWVLTCCPLACSKRSGAWCRSVRSTSLATTARNW